MSGHEGRPLTGSRGGVWETEVTLHAVMQGSFSGRKLSQMEVQSCGQLITPLAQW